jgi:hypothetical protein
VSTFAIRTLVSEAAIEVVDLLNDLVDVDSRKQPSAAYADRMRAKRAGRLGRPTVRFWHFELVDQRDVTFTIVRKLLAAGYTENEAFAVVARVRRTLFAGRTVNEMREGYGLTPLPDDYVDASQFAQFIVKNRAK